MSPERIGNTNMWRLLKGECITGRASEGSYTLYGPRTVRVYLYPNDGSSGSMRIQAEIKSIEVDGLDFPAVVKPVKENKSS